MIRRALSRFWRILKKGAFGAAMFALGGVYVAVLIESPAMLQLALYTLRHRLL